MGDGDHDFAFGSCSPLSSPQKKERKKGQMENGNHDFIFVPFSFSPSPSIKKKEKRKKVGGVLRRRGSWLRPPFSLFPFSLPPPRIPPALHPEKGRKETEIIASSLYLSLPSSLSLEKKKKEKGNHRFAFVPIYDGLCLTYRHIES